MTKTLTTAEALKRLAKLRGEVEKTVHPVYPGLKKQKDAIQYVLTKDILWKLFKFYSPDYILNEKNREFVFTVLRYFLKDENFNQYGKINNAPSLDKGLLIYGSNGVGKSFLFEILSKIGRELIIKKNCSDLWFTSISSGSFVDQYMRAAGDRENVEVFDIKNFYTGKLYIDDLGFEKKAFNKTELFGEILFERNRVSSKTYVTTNLKPSELTNKYGERIGDRLPEMFNIIKWDGESFRE
jgi:hypothetical protein